MTVVRRVSLWKEIFTFLSGAGTKVMNSSMWPTWSQSENRATGSCTFWAHKKSWTTLVMFRPRVALFKNKNKKTGMQLRPPPCPVPRQWPRSVCDQVRSWERTVRCTCCRLTWERPLRWGFCPGGSSFHPRRQEGLPPDYRTSPDCSHLFAGPPWLHSQSQDPEFRKRIQDVWMYSMLFLKFIRGKKKKEWNTKLTSLFR